MDIHHYWRSDSVLSPQQIVEVYACQLSVVARVVRLRSALVFPTPSAGPGRTTTFPDGLNSGSAHWIFLSNSLLNIWNPPSTNPLSWTSHHQGSLKRLAVPTCLCVCAHVCAFARNTWVSMWVVDVYACVRRKRNCRGGCGYKCLLHGCMHVCKFSPKWLFVSTH